MWIWFFRNSPKKHPYISARERDFILVHTEQQLSRGIKRGAHVPWRAILTSLPCWALFTVHTCFSYSSYTFLTSIPKYMSEVLRFDIKSVTAILRPAHPTVFCNLEWYPVCCALRCGLVDELDVGHRSRSIDSAKASQRHRHEKVLHKHRQYSGRPARLRSRFHHLPSEIPRCCPADYRHSIKVGASLM